MPTPSKLTASELLGRFLLTAVTLILAVGTFAGAVTTDGALRMEVITAYNFVVDSNIETPAGKSPSAAHLGVKIHNDGATALTNVVVNIGNMTSPGSGTPGVFASRTVNEVGQYAGTFALTMPGGATDAVRVIPRIEPGEYVVQYFFVVYPLLDSLNRSVTGAASVPGDDLWLNYDIWASANEGVPLRKVDQRTKVTMRNEISAMANKIWPNGDNKVPEEYLSVIESFLGWRPTTDNPRIPGAEIKEGIWYDLGNVGAGFDNNGDVIPDRNAWLQPVGDPSQFNPLGARMVKCYGIVIVKLNDGTEKLIPFEDQLYFENFPANNTGAVGLVYYEFLPLNASLPTRLTPYQEVASGYDNEKFNADFGIVIGSGAINDPEAQIVKTGPASRALGQNADYTLTTTNTGTIPLGWPDLGLPIVIEDPIPTGLQYVANSATTVTNVTNPAGGIYTVSYSTDDGATWSATQPSPATLVNRLRWVLDRALQPGNTATVTFSATVPTGFTGINFTNTAILKTGTFTEVDRDTWTTTVPGINSVGNFIWKDLDRDGVQDGGLEVGIPNIGVSLYVDTNGNGTLDSGEPLYASTSTNGSGDYLFSNLPDRKYIVVVNSTDPDLIYGYTLKAGVNDRFAIDLDSAATNPSAVSILTADWPFIAGLEVTKSVSPTTYSGGDLITYSIDLDNHMNTLTLPLASVQTVYATSTAFDTNNANGKAVENAAAGAPNSVFTNIDWNANADRLVTTGITPSITSLNGGAVTKVELIVRGYMTKRLVDDGLNVEIGYTDRSIAVYAPATRTTAQMNALVGVSQDMVLDITGASTGWTLAQVQSLTAALKATKNQGGDTGDYNVDSIAFRVTTNNTPFAGIYRPNTIVDWPLHDTYDPNKLEFISASVMPDVTSTPGTLEWYNLGPVNAGARKTITVTFRAKTPTDTNADGKRDPMIANNFVTTVNSSLGDVPLFASGLPAGHDDGTVNVTINPAGRIGDFVYWDINANSAYEGGTDVSIRNVIVQLFRDLGAGFVYTGRSQITDINGYYEFTGLTDGTYRIQITTDTANDLFTLPWTTFTSYQKGLAGTNQTGFVQGDSVVINNADFVTTNDTNFVQDFGFDSNAASLISGTLFRDWNGNGIQNPGDEPLVGYTLTLTGGATATTDSNGYYLFSNITAAGDKTVTVTAPPASHTQTLDPDATVNNATTITPFGLGFAYKFKNFAYRPTGSLTLGDTLYYDWNGNRSQGSGEGGIPNVTVRLYEDSNGDGIIQGTTDAFIASVVTGSNGFYQFTGLPTGNYIVHVDAADSDFPPDHLQTQDFDGLYDDRAKVNLTASTSDVDFGYLPTGTSSIGNLVWLDADNNGIKDTGEFGINGVTVQLFRSDQTPGVSTPYFTTTTSGGGLYSFNSLPAGSYYVYIPASNFGSGQALVNYPRSSSTTVNSDNQTDNDDNGIQLSLAGATTSPLIALSAESDQTIDFGFSATASIGDIVFYDLNANGTLDYSETGINGVIVELYLDANDDNIADGASIATVTTATVGGVSGFYEFTGLSPNRYIVKVRTSTLPAGLIQTADPDLDGIPVNNTDLDPDNNGDHADTDIVLFFGSDYGAADFGYQPPGAIGDYVWLDIDRDGVQDIGEPGISGVVIRVTNGLGTTYDITTDTDGLWAQVVADGSWTVSVLTPPAGRINTYDADSGIVSPNASVAVTVAAGVVSGLAQGNLGLDFGYALNGNYSLTGTVAINDTGVIGKHTDIDDFIDDGSDLDAGPNDETELPGVLVYLYSNTGIFLGSTYTDGGGNYAFTNLPNGGYSVIIGTSTPPLDRATLKTTNGNYTDGTSVSDTGSTVRQQVTITGVSLVDIDFMFDSDVDYDFGDLPSLYPMTRLTQDGARHIIPNGGSTLYMGTAPDMETNGAPSLRANSDDLFGSDDENGLTVNASTWANGTNGGSASVQVTGTGWLVGWIDWNHDGDFLDADEMIADRAVSTGNVALTFNIPVNLTVNGSPVPFDITGNQSWLSRFRLFPSQPDFSLFSYIGEATGGEVEDHLIEKISGGSIGDIVWIDSDGNGAINGSESGFGGVVVQLRDSGGINVLATRTTSNGTQDVDGDGLIDPVGYYRFRGLSAATYHIVVPTTPIGYSVSYDENSGTTNPDGITQVILATDVQYLTADFGYEPELANISGQVRYDTDSDGNPADLDAGALAVKIQLWTDPNGDGDPADGVQVRETYTDASGNYLFTGVATGNYVVVEINPAGTTSTYDVAGLNDDRVPVVMVGSNITGRDFLDTNPPVYAISGSVYDDAPANNNTIDGADTALGGVTVKLYFDRDGNGVVSPGDTLLTTTSTASNGSYSFSGLVAGSYVVQKTNPAGGSVTNDWDASADLVLTDSEIGVVLSSANVTQRDFLIDGYLGTIAGQVLKDTDNNNTGDAPFPGVTLTLLNSDGSVYDSDPVAGGIQSITAVTDSSGNYSFANVPPGDYRVSETQPSGYASVSDKDNGNLDEIGDETLIAVTGGVTNSGNNFVEEQYGVISGVVQSDTDNNNTGDTNLSGVTVQLFADTNADGVPDGSALQTLITNGSGAYTFTNVLPGSYVVVETDLTGYQSVSDTDASADASGSPVDLANGSATDNRLPVTLAAGETDSGNNFLDEQSGVISGIVRVDTNRDTTGDAGISGVTVKLFADANGDGVADSSTAVATQTTDSNGAYTFTGVAPGGYVVVETDSAGYVSIADGDSTTDLGTSPADVANASQTDNLLSVNLKAGETDSGNDYVDRGTGSISDYVWNDRNGDGVQASGEPPLAGVRVFIDTNADGMWQSTEPTSVTNATGAYLISNLAPGSYLVRVDTSTLPAGVTATFDLDGVGTASRTNVTLGAGQAETSADFGYRGNASIGDLVWNDINSDGSKGVGEVGFVGAVVFIDLDGDGILDTNEPFATTDSTGAYTISNLTPGTYKVMVDTSTLPPGAVPTYDLDGTTVSPNGIALNVALTAAQNRTDVDFGFQSNATLGEHVWNDLNGNGTQEVGEPGLAGVRVYIDSNGNSAYDSGEPTGVTDASGIYFITGLNANSTGYPVRVDTTTLPASLTPSYDLDGTTTPNAASATLAANQIRSDVDFGYVGSSTIGNYVWLDRDADGVQEAGEPPLSGVQVFLDLNNNGTWESTEPIRTTSATGSYSFSGLAAGTYHVVVLSSTLPDTVIATFDADGTGTLNAATVVLPAATTNNNADFGYVGTSTPLGDYVWVDVDGDGIQESGEPPLSGVTVFIDLDGNGLRGTSEPFATTDSSGLYAIIGMNGGTYKVMVETSTLPAGLTPSYDLDGTATANYVAALSLGVNATLSTVDFGYRGTGSITGTVKADTDNNNTGDAALTGVTVTLYTDPNGDGDPSDGVVYGSPVLTGVGGTYSFGGVMVGSYVVVETQPTGYLDLSDTDSTTDIGSPADAANSSTLDNRIAVTLAADETDSGNDFVDEQLGSVTGSVLADTDNDNVGESTAPIANVSLTLKDSSGNDIDSNPNISGVQPTTTTTQADGSYSFSNVPPGSYKIVETQPSGYLSVSDVDGDNLNIIGDVTLVTVSAGVTTANQNFVEEQPGTIAGHLYIDINGDGDQDGGEPNLANVDVKVTDSNNITQTVVTDSNGNWSATVPPGNTTADVDNADAQYPTGYAQTEGDDPTTVTAVVGTQVNGGIDGYHIDLDTDDDGIPDTVEVANNCDLDGDTDGDGVPDILDLDSDGDGIFDLVEAGHGALDANKDGRVDTTQGNNGLANSVETATDSGVITYTLRDTDGDLRPDGLDLDSDNDSIGDLMESGNGGIVDTRVGGLLDGIADGIVNADGIVANAGAVAPVDADADLLPDYRDLDSDGDGVFDIVDNGFGALDITPVPDGMIDNAVSADCDGIVDVLDPKDNEYGWFPPMGCPDWNLSNAADTDGDVFPEDQEYVFGGDPELGDHRVSGTTRRAGMTIAKNGTLVVPGGQPGGVDISWVRPQGRFDAVVTLYVSHDPQIGVASWTPVATQPEIIENGDTTQTLIWRNVHDIDGNLDVTRDRGFARLKVETPCNPGGSWTLVQGWSRQWIDGKRQSYGVNFSSMPVFTGIVDSAAGSTITTATSGKGQDLSTYLAGGATCYIEFTDGSGEGQRFNIASGGVNSFILDLASAHNTTNVLPSNLAASHFVVRRHDTLGSVYVNGEWDKASSPGSADQVLLYTGTGYDTYYNLFTNFWVKQGAGFSSQNPLIIAPGTGMMVVHANPTDLNELLSLGELRYNDFRRPVKLGTTGLNFMALGYPFDASPASLDMTTGNGFIASSTVGSASQTLNWIADTTINAVGWTSNFYHSDGNWRTQGTPDNITSDSPLFSHCRSAHVKVQADQLEWTHLLPWNPAPWVQPAP